MRANRRTLSLPAAPKRAAALIRRRLSVLDNTRWVRRALVGAFCRRSAWAAVSPG